MDWTWLVMALETAVFLAFSAALWLLVIKHADTGRDARGAGRVTTETAVVAGAPKIGWPASTRRRDSGARQQAARRAA